MVTVELYSACAGKALRLEIVEESDFSNAA